MMQTEATPTSGQLPTDAAAHASDALPPAILPGWLDLAMLLAGAAVLALAWRKGVIGARAARTIKRDVSFQPPIIWFAAALLGLLFAALALALAQTLLKGWAGPPNTPRGVAAPMLGMYLLSGLAGLVLARVLYQRAARRVESPESVLLRPRDALKGLIWLLACLPVVLAASVLATWMHRLMAGQAPDPIAHDTLKIILSSRADPWTWGVMAAAAFGAPLTEELIYRCFLQSALVAATGRAWLAILTTSLLFAGVHMNNVPPHALAPLFVLSLCLGVAYERTRSIMVPITMHVLFNAGNIAVALMLA